MSKFEKMDVTKKIARLIGPSIGVMGFSEMKFWNPTLYDTQIVPLIYLNGLLLFVAGLAIVNNHNIWRLSWETLITILGYALMILGAFRMLFPEIQNSEFNNDDTIFLVEIVLFLMGTYITYKGYFCKN